MKLFFTIVLFVLLVIAALTVGGGLLVLLSFGVGWLLNLVMHFDPFQATAISLAGICIFGFLAERLWQSVMATRDMDDDEYDDEYDEFDFDDEDEDEDDEEPVAYPGIPLWRQPLKKVDFSKAKPDDRCPCGSGRKYKNCHGTKQKK